MFKTEYLPFWNFALSPARLFDFSRYLYKVFLLSIYNYTLQLLDRSCDTRDQMRYLFIAAVIKY